MSRFSIYMLIIIAGSLLVSCGATRKVPAGDALYMGATIKLDGPELSARKKKDLRKDLASRTRPRPNQRVLGIPFKLLFNNIPFLRKKMGEPPVLLSSLNLEHNEKLLQSTLENRGFFHAKVDGDTVVKRKRARATYTVQTGYQYHIKDIAFVNDSSQLAKAIQATIPKSFLKTGDPFDLDLIKGERERIDAYLKDHGFYYFNPDFIIVQADTTVGDKKVNLRVNIKPETPFQSREIYRINDVFIYPNYTLRSNTNDTTKNAGQYYKGYYVVDNRKQYKPRLFEQAMQFDPGDIYNRKDHNLTISRLVNLNLFKFVKNRFEKVDRTDSAQLDAYYYLTAFPRKSLRGEINANTKSNNLTGSSITMGWRNRNTLKGGELFSIDATLGFEVQFSGQYRGYNTFRGGLEANFVVPRFLVPVKIRKVKGGFIPRTNFLLGYDMLNKQKLYTMQSFRAGYGYSWKESFQKEHTFNVVNINYVQPFNVTPVYKDSILVNPSLAKAIERQFILGTNYNYNFNGLFGKPNHSSGMYFNGNIDLSGNVAGLITGANAKANKQKNIFNAPFSQYVRLESDLRYYSKVSPSTIWANRIIAAVGIPYGNSTQLPYIKQFFVGGTNSLRAFRSRSVGPGTFKDSTTTFLPDQSGDIKLELNTELRIKLASVVHGAIFIDAGNIWLFNEDTLKPGAKFTGDFLSQLAVGGGVGLRFDISFLVIRFDVAVPFRKPWLANKERWVIDQVDYKEKSWRKENIVYNLGIGYPF